MKVSWIKITTILLMTCFYACENQEDQPNIIFILADDMGYSDLGYQGSLIDTPILDSLASKSIVFPNFYNAGTCTPSRAALLSGKYPHRVGCGSNGKDHKVAAYRGFLSKEAVTLPQFLKRLDYRTYISGKWQLGWKDGQRPLSRGFDQAFQMGKGGKGGTYFYPFVYRTNALPLLNDYPSPFNIYSFYTTDAFTDHALDFLLDHTTNHNDKPFFLYLPYNAPHFPLQAKQEDIEKYIPVFKEGYSKVLEAKDSTSIKKLLSEELTEKWNSLTLEEQNDEVIKMATYAAQIESLDANIGRLVTFLNQKNLSNNTYIFFTSDNGSNHNLLGDKDNSKEVQIGSNKSWTSYGKSWAKVSNYPYKYFKSFAHEGGIKSPLYVYREGGETRYDNQVVHITDILPTILDLAGMEKKPDTDGISMRDNIVGSSTQKNNKPRTLYWETLGHRALRSDNWKLVSISDRKDSHWELYNLSNDPYETTDLSSIKSEITISLSRDYERWAAKMNIIPTDSLTQIFKN